MGSIPHGEGGVHLNLQPPKGIRGRHQTFPHSTINVEFRGEWAREWSWRLRPFGLAQDRLRVTHLLEGRTFCWTSDSDNCMLWGDGYLTPDGERHTPSPLIPEEESAPRRRAATLRRSAREKKGYPPCFCETNRIGFDVKRALNPLRIGIGPAIGREQFESVRSSAESTRRRCRACQSRLQRTAENGAGKAATGREYSQENERDEQGS